ncbi:MAG: hypothetical protein GY858_05395 [Candidatus Omnitrophica bacterium]|nr:hypothetical protein [Candidatus Omnitrophota bacterium]
MKFLKIFLIVILTLAVVVYSVVFFAVNSKGKEMIVKSVEKSLGVKPELESVSLKFPFHLEVKGFKVSDFSVDEIRLAPDIIYLIIGRIALNKVYVNGFNMKVEVNKDILKKISLLSERLPQKIGFELIPSVYADSLAIPSIKYLKVKSLDINNGSLEIVNVKKGKSVSFKLTKMSAKLKNFVYPELPKFYIDLNASLEGKGVSMENALSARGWIDYRNKNMDMTINAKDIDYAAFSDYYSPNWKPDKIGLKEAIFVFYAKAEAKDNELVIDCVLTAERVSFVPEEQLEDATRMRNTKTVLAILKGSGEKPVLPFRLKTTMDAPKFDMSSAKASLKGKVNFPKLLLGSFVGKVTKKISETSEKTKEVTLDTAIDAVKDVVNEFKAVYDNNKAQ